MPFCRKKVESPAVNYRGAKKSAGRKLGAKVYNGGLIYPKSNTKSGIPPRLGRSRAKRLPSCRCRIVSIPPMQAVKR